MSITDLQWLVDTCKIFYDGCHVYRRAHSNTQTVRPHLQIPVHPPHWKCHVSSLRLRHCFLTFLSTPCWHVYYISANKFRIKTAPTQNNIITTILHYHWMAGRKISYNDLHQLTHCVYKVHKQMPLFSSL